VVSRSDDLVEQVDRPAERATTNQDRAARGSLAPKYAGRRAAEHRERGFVGNAAVRETNASATSVRQNRNSQVKSATRWLVFFACRWPGIRM
jgi:hypothetical protein